MDPSTPASPGPRRNRCRAIPAAKQASRVSSHRLRTCCAHHTGEQGGLHTSDYPTVLDGLLLIMRGDSALAFNLSGPAQASLALRPVHFQPAQGGFLFPGLRRVGHPSRRPGSYEDVPTPPSAGLPPAAFDSTFTAHSHPTLAQGNRIRDWIKPPSISDARLRFLLAPKKIFRSRALIE